MIRQYRHGTGTTNFELCGGCVDVNDVSPLEAAKRVCLGAGAKVDLAFSHHLTNEDIQRIKDDNIDIILLSGGTDGGNSECVLYNERKLAESGIKIPIIYAGNKNCHDDISAIAKKYNLDEYMCANVMPRLNVLNIPDAREKIREIFLKKIAAYSCAFQVAYLFQIQF